MADSILPVDTAVYCAIFYKCMTTYQLYMSAYLTISYQYELLLSRQYCTKFRGADAAHAVEHSGATVWILLYGGSILHGGCICNLGYVLFQPVAHNNIIQYIGARTGQDFACFETILKLDL